MASSAPIRIRDEEFSKTETDLVASVRALIQEEVAQAVGKKEPVKVAGRQLGHSHFFFIMVLALDLALVFVYILDLFPDFEQNRVISSIAKLLPFVGGTLLVTYLDKVRVGILRLTEKKGFRRMCIAALPFLFAFQIHFYSVYVDIHPATAHVQFADKGKYRDAEFSDPARRFHLLLPTPSHYSVRLENDDSSVYDISAWQVFKGTLARLPLLGRSIAPLRMDALIEVNIYTPKNHGSLTVEGPDTPGMRISKLSRGVMVKPGIYRWQRYFSGEDNIPSIHLPAGKYVFELEVEGCRKRMEHEIKRIEDETNSDVDLDFRPLCDN